MSLVGMLVFMVVIGTIGAVMLLTALIDRAPAHTPVVTEGFGMVPAPRDGAAVDVVEPEAGGVR
jgi:hypothetical protein